MDLANTIITRRRNCWLEILNIRETGVNTIKPMVRMTETRKMTRIMTRMTRMIKMMKRMMTRMTRIIRMMKRMMTMERGDSPLASCPHPPLHCRHWSFFSDILLFFLFQIEYLNFFFLLQILSLPKRLLSHISPKYFTLRLQLSYLIHLRTRWKGDIQKMIIIVYMTSYSGQRHQDEKQGKI